MSFHSNFQFENNRRNYFFWTLVLQESVQNIPGWGGGGGGVLRISSDGDDQRIFMGLKFSIPGFFGHLKQREDSR